MVPLVHAGTYTVTLNIKPTADGARQQLWLGVQRGAGTVHGPYFVVDRGTAHTVVVTTDPEKHQLAGSVDGKVGLSMPSRNLEPIHVAEHRTQKHLGCSVGHELGDFAAGALSELDPLTDQDKSFRAWKLTCLPRRTTRPPFHMEERRPEGRRKRASCRCASEDASHVGRGCSAARSSSGCGC